MFGSWLSSTKASNDRKQTHPPPKHSTETQSDSNRDAEGSASTRPSVERAVTTQLSTPHDTVLAELHGHGTYLAPPAPIHGAPASAQSAAADSGSTERSGAATPSAALRSVASSPDNARDGLHDPFTGVLLGVPAPTGGASKERPREPGSAHLDQSKDELWAHLARIRELQNEIAGMHVQMEGIGSSEPRASKQVPVAMDRVHTETIPGDEWDTAEEAEQPRKDAQDAEFTKLTKMFEGRRAAIDGIMDKLDDLSKSLTTFHALPNPTMDFTSSRSATRDSGGLSSPIQSRFSTMEMPTSPTSIISPTAARTPNILISQPDGSDPVLLDSPVDVGNHIPTKAKASH